MPRDEEASQSPELEEASTNRRWVNFVWPSNSNLNLVSNATQTRNQPSKKRDKGLRLMLANGKGTNNGRANRYLDPDAFTAAWIEEMRRLESGEPTEILRNGKLVNEGVHQYYTSSGRPAKQM